MSEGGEGGSEGGREGGSKGGTGFKHTSPDSDIYTACNVQQTLLRCLAETHN